MRALTSLLNFFGPAHPSSPADERYIELEFEVRAEIARIRDLNRVIELAQREKAERESIVSGLELAMAAIKPLRQIPAEQRLLESLVTDLEDQIGKEFSNEQN